MSNPTFLVIASGSLVYDINTKNTAWAVQMMVLRTAGNLMFRIRQLIRLDEWLRLSFWRLRGIKVCDLNTSSNTRQLFNHLLTNKAKAASPSFECSGVV